MPIHATALGQSAGESVLDITARLTMAYAAGVEAEEACYLDDLRADGVVAPPPFCVSLEWPVVNGSRCRDVTGVTADEAWGGIHVQQDSTFHRAVRPGDRLRTSGRVVKIGPTSAGTLVVLKLETRDERSGEPVVTSYSSTIFLRVPPEGAPGTLEAPPELRGEGAITVLPAGCVALPTARRMAHVYTECAGIWNPIHTQRRIAQEKQLPDVILHGTCTWALAGVELIRRCAEGDPLRLKRLAGRFHGMVIPGTTIGLEYGVEPGEPGKVQFTVTNAAGELAISHGLAEFAA
jgi:acyl dehydratase